MLTPNNMAPFSFPDPAVTPSIVHPDTGDLWIFADGVWMISDPQDPDGAIDSNTPVTICEDDDDLADADISALRTEIQTLRNDIIELKAQLQAASLNNFLILE